MRPLFPVLLALTSLLLLWGETSAPRRIGFARVGAQSGQPALFIAAADGSDEHPLLSSSNDGYNAAWAPDGGSIVFTSERNGSADLFRVKPDGAGLTRLTTDPAYDDQAAFSPDSKQLVFVSTRGNGLANLWIMEIATGHASQLTAVAGGNFRPSWSADGKWIAFSSGRGNPLPFAEGRWERLQLADIYIVHPDGSGLKKVTAGGGFCGSPKWMSDNRHLVAYCMSAQQTLANRLFLQPGSETGLVSIDTTTAKSSDLTASPGVKMDPVPLAANEIGYITKGPGEPGIDYSSGRKGPRGAIRSASWSPDGKRVVFYKRIPAGPDPLQKTFSRNPNYELLLTGSLPAFSPSGKEFVTGGTPSASPVGSSLELTTVATGTTKILYQDKTRNVLAGAWAPGGDRIVFGIGAFAAFFDGFHSEFLKPGDRIEGGAQIAMINTDGTGFKELTTASGNNAFPSFAPDGKRLVYRTFSDQGDGLRILNPETKAVTVLTSGYDNFPLWSPRGDLIMFARLAGGTYDVYTIRPDGSSLKRLTNGNGNDAHMAWSPDGEYIAFASSRMGFKDEALYTDAPQPYGEIFVMRYDGTGVEQLTDNQWEDGTPAWQPVPVNTAPLR
jgi:Tol biopolymer transport system component